ncbi:MAG: DUF3800 domain-containing protein [Actinomycetaceae bacterium]|nr:DUF3800 domain-containing protein [Arcanobacterium sp.]MDD7687611.1 DUF3800 domain-containing protein [Actinomycetaceae bacterium]MDY5273151.1 DUF3800 domain-containing protein [Arcanobacterium sp.]
MLIAYLDESQRADHYFMAAAVANEAVWLDVNQAMDKLRQQIVRAYEGLPERIEFHGHPMMGGAHDWKTMRGRHREIGEIYLQALGAICANEVQFFAYGVDVRRLNARYRYPEPPHIVCMEGVLAQVDEYARQLGASGLQIVADDSSESKQLQARFKAKQANMSFADSASVEGLQAVDLALYVMQRRYLVPIEKSRKAQQLREKLWAIIEPRINAFTVSLP